MSEALTVRFLALWRDWFVISTSTFTRLGTIVLLVFCLLVTGCTKSKVTKVNYDKIENGMTLDEVERILGSGTLTAGDPSLIVAKAGVDLGSGRPTTIEYTWDDGKKSIVVGFREGK